MSDRLEAVESLVTHLERELAAMHDVLLAQQREIGELRRELGKTEARIDRIETGPEKRDPVAEKPPHY